MFMRSKIPDDSEPLNVQTILQTVCDQNSLAVLFEQLTLEYKDNNLTSPKWKEFRSQKLRFEQKMRLNNAIWRAWFIQYRLNRKSKFCQFIPPFSYMDIYVSNQCMVMEGKYWSRRLEAVAKEYHNWRLYYKSKVVPSQSGSCASLQRSTCYSEAGCALPSCLSTQTEQDQNIMNVQQPSLSMLNPSVDGMLKGLTDASGTIPDQNAFSVDMFFRDDIRLMINLSKSDEAKRRRECSNDGAASDLVTSPAPDDLSSFLPPMDDMCLGSGIDESLNDQSWQDINLPDSSEMLPGPSSLDLNLPQEDSSMYLGPEGFPTPLNSSLSLPFMNQQSCLGRSALPKNKSDTSLSTLLFRQPSHRVHQIELNYGEPVTPSKRARMLPRSSSGSRVSELVPRLRSNSTSNKHRGGSLPKNFSDSNLKDLADSRNKSLPPILPKALPNSQYMIMNYQPVGQFPTSTCSVVPPSQGPPFSIQINSPLVSMQPLNSTQQLVLPRMDLGTRFPLQLTSVGVGPPRVSNSSTTTPLALLLASSPSSWNTVTGTSSALYQSSTQSVAVPSSATTGCDSQTRPGWESGQSTPILCSAGRTAVTGRFIQADEKRRQVHTVSEQRRRFSINEGFRLLSACVPMLRETSPLIKVSKATTLMLAKENLESLQAELEQREKLVECLKKEVNAIKDSLLNIGAQNDCSLLTSEGPVMKSLYISRIRPMVHTDPKFWIFSILTRSLVESYVREVRGRTQEPFVQSMLQWKNHHLSIRALRSAVLDGLETVSTSTCLLQQPADLAAQASRASALDDPTLITITPDSVTVTLTDQPSVSSRPSWTGLDPRSSVEQAACLPTLSRSPYS